MSEPIELTEEQVERLKEVFSLFDKDGNGTITIHELGTIMRAMDEYPTEAELAAIIEEIDADGNQIIEFPELVDLMARRHWGHAENGSENELLEALEQFDHANTGQFNMAELRASLTGSGEALSDEQVDHMFRFLAPDGDGNASLEEFVELMQNPLSRQLPDDL